MATLVSYLVPPLQQAGLYKGLRALKDTLDRYRTAPDAALLEDIVAQAEKLGLNVDGTQLGGEGTDDSQLAAAGGLPAEQYVAAIGHELLKIEERMIPSGLHVLGKSPAPAELVDFLMLTASFRPAGGRGSPTFPAIVATSLGYDYADLHGRLGSDTAAQEQWRQVELICKEAINRFVAECKVQSIDRPISQGGAQSGITNLHAAAKHADAYLRDHAKLHAGSLDELWAFLGDLLAKLQSPQEVQGLLHGLRGGFIPPSPSNDVVRDPGVLPTGRNVYSLDPYRVPSACGHGARRPPGDRAAGPPGGRAGRAAADGGGGALGQR